MQVIKALFAAAGLIALRGPLAFGQGSDQVAGGAVIATSAHAEVQAVPDRSTVNLGVQSRAKSAEAASAQNAQTEVAILSALHALGIKDSDVTTEAYTVTPETAYPRDSLGPRTVSYLVISTVAVRLASVARVGKVIDASLAAGANQVLSVEFSFADSDSLYRDALARAVSRAQRQAQTMAVAAGGTLGPLLELSTAPAAWPQPIVTRMGAATAMVGAQTPILPGSATVSASVTGRWRFTPHR